MKNRSKLFVKGKRKKNRIKIQAIAKVQDQSFFFQSSDYDIKVFDLSEGGIKAASFQPMKDNTKVLISFKSKNLISSIDIKARVRWTKTIHKNNRYLTMAGFEFTQMNNNLYDRLATMLITQ